MTEAPPPLLSVRDLSVRFTVRVAGRARHLDAVRGVSFDIARGSSFGLVGESGSGKSTTARSLLGLAPMSGGEVTFDGQPIDPPSLSKAQRRRMQMVFQDVSGSLNPRATVLRTLATPALLHGLVTRGGARARAAELLASVGLLEAHLDRYPTELSGGQRQRVGIARALAVQPDLVVCDEPVSALDVSVRAQIMRLLAEQQAERGLTYLFIAHDLALVSQISDHVGVMYLGSLVEVGRREEVLYRPLHPYTQALVSAQPVPDPVAERKRPRIVLQGDPPSPFAPPSGCAFRSRCPLHEELGRPDECRDVPPVLGPSGGAHAVACHFRGVTTAPAPEILPMEKNYAL